MRAPKGVSLRQVEQTLRDNALWVLKQMDKLAARGLPLPARQFTDSEILPYLGSNINLQIAPGFGHKSFLRQRDDHLVMQVPFELEGQERRTIILNTLVNWYRGQARKQLAPRLQHFCRQLAAPMPSFKISNARSRWGSCDSRGQIQLSWRLMLLPVELSDYVLAHEACHLHHMDHSANFWKLLDSIMPQAQELRARLDKEGPLYKLD